MIIALVFRLFFIVSALFLLLVCGLAAALFLKMHLRDTLSMQREKEERQGYRKRNDRDGKVIEGEYKVLDESHKE